MQEQADLVTTLHSPQSRADRAAPPPAAAASEAVGQRDMDMIAEQLGIAHDVLIDALTTAEGVGEAVQLQQEIRRLYDSVRSGHKSADQARNDLRQFMDHMRAAPTAAPGATSRKRGLEAQEVAASQAKAEAARTAARQDAEVRASTRAAAQRQEEIAREREHAAAAEAAAAAAAQTAQSFSGPMSTAAEAGLLEVENVQRPRNRGRGSDREIEQARRSYEQNRGSDSYHVRNASIDNYARAQHGDGEAGHRASRGMSERASFDQVVQGGPAAVAGAGARQVRDMAMDAQITLLLRSGKLPPELVRRFDQNGDNRIDFWEYDRVRRAVDMSYQQMAALDQSSGVMGAVNNRIISEQEFVSASRAMGLLLSISTQDLALMGQRYGHNRTIDANNDGHITLNEVRRMINGQRINGRQMRVSDVDTNRDGVLSRQEVDAVMLRAEVRERVGPNGNLDATIAALRNAGVSRADQVDTQAEFNTAMGRAPAAQRQGQGQPTFENIVRSSERMINGNPALKRLFRDTDGSGDISVAEITAGLRRMGITSIETIGHRDNADGRNIVDRADLIHRLEGRQVRQRS